MVAQKWQLAVVAFLLLAGLARATDSPLMPEVINEGSTSTLTLAFSDQNGNPVSPRDIRFWSDDVETLTRLYGATPIAVPTPVSPASSVDITIPPGGNRIVTDTKETEEHTATAVFLYGATCTPGTPSTCSTGTTECRMMVRNIRVVVGAGTGPTPAP